jgi:hypothetical protein
MFFRGIGNDWWLKSFPSSTNFPTEQTNLWCIAYLTNCGSTRIWWISSDCEIEARTPNGWITNKFSHFTTVPWSVGPFKKDIFYIGVPIDAIEWRVKGQYEYYNRHFPSLEFMGWLSDDLEWGTKKRPSSFLVYSVMPIAWTMSLAPRPKEKWQEFQSEFFTNRLPAGFSFTNSPKP